jgi:hypothetical protein
LGARFLSADSFFLGWDAIRFSTFCTPPPTCLDTIDKRAANFFLFPPKIGLSLLRRAGMLTV